MHKGSKRMRSSSAVSNAAIIDEAAAKHSKAENRAEVSKADSKDAEDATDQYTVATGATFPMLLIDTASVVLTDSNAGVPVYRGPSQFAFVLEDEHATVPWTFTGRDLTLEHTSLYGPGGALSEVFGTKAEMVAEEFYSEEMKALGYDMMFCDANGLSKRLKPNTLATNMLLTGGKGARHSGHHIGHAVYGPVVLVSMKTLEMEQSNHSEDIEEGSEEDEQEEDYEEGEHEQDEDYQEEDEQEDSEGGEEDEDEEDEEDSEEVDEDSEE